MRTILLLSGAALAVTAAPALAGGPLGSGLVGNPLSASQTTRTVTRTTTVTRSSSRSQQSSSNALANCLCQTVHGLTARNTSLGRRTNAAVLVNSVVGLTSSSRTNYGHNGGQSFGLAGTVTNSVNSALAGHVSHGGGLAGRPVAN